VTREALFDFSGTVALVTGVSRGMGLEIARQLVTNGASVLVSGLDDDALATAAETLAWLTSSSGSAGSRVIAMAADLAHPSASARQIDRAYEEFGTLFLTDPDVPIDTNHVERALRVIPMGRKGWLFCWTELGAKHVGIIQSLIVTCRLHGIDPYTYLVDVLQRFAEHPANRVAELTPRLWNQRFAANPLRSAIHEFPGDRVT
jgi:NAD(P)-dependent dehydrogenase (short-subunit alcohol dehydrogenase family)